MSVNRNNLVNYTITNSYHNNSTKTALSTEDVTLEPTVRTRRLQPKTEDARAPFFGEVGDGVPLEDVVEVDLLPAVFVLVRGFVVAVFEVDVVSCKLLPMVATVVH